MVESAISVAQAAKRSPFSEPTIRNMIRRGELEVVKYGRSVFVTVESLQKNLGILFRPQ